MEIILPLIFSAIIAIATIVYVIFSGQLVAESTKLRESQTSPEIVVYLQPAENVGFGVEIIVKNIGGGIAYNLRWKYDKDAALISEGRTEFKRLKFFDGVPYFAPGQEYRSYIGSWHGILTEPIPPAFSLEVYFENQNKKAFTSEFIIDPRMYSGRMWIGGQPLKDIADSLKQIERRVNEVVSGFHRAKVDIFTYVDRQRDAAAWEEYKASQTEEQEPKDGEGTE